MANMSFNIPISFHMEIWTHIYMRLQAGTGYVRNTNFMQILLIWNINKLSWECHTQINKFSLIDNSTGVQVSGTQLNYQSSYQSALFHYQHVLCWWWYNCVGDTAQHWKRKLSCGWVCGWMVLVREYCHSVAHLQILRLAKNPRWSQVWQYMCHLNTKDTNNVSTHSIRFFRLFCIQFLKVQSGTISRIDAVIFHINIGSLQPSLRNLNIKGGKDAVFKLQ